MKPTLLTTRFDAQTWAENAAYRDKYCDVKSRQCLYAAPKEITCAVKLDSRCYVLELNNTTNRIEGVGFIMNRANYGRTIYSYSDHNRCYYLGHYYIDRDTVQRWLPELLPRLENALFRSRKHLKRGLGITVVSPKWLQLQNLTDMLEEIRVVFQWLF